jgi:peptidyl-prolyl cis-trans isomerase D
VCFYDDPEATIKQANRRASGDAITTLQLRTGKPLAYDTRYMFSAFRRHNYSLATRVMIIGLCTVFALFFGGLGAATYMNQPNAVASIDCYTYFHMFTLPGCTNIMPEQIDQEAAKIRRAVEHNRGAEAAQLLQGVNLREMAVESLVVQTLIEREAHRLGLTVSDDDLAHAIESQTVFQVDGRFDPDRYRAILRDNDLLPAVFEADTRAKILSDSLRQFVMASVQASPAEARADFDHFGEKVDLAYVAFPYTNFTASEHPTEAEVAKFYKDNPETFREPERVKISFIRYDPAALAPNTPPTDQAVQEYFEQNLKTLFTHPTQIHVRHILIQVAPDASPAQKAAARRRAEDLLTQIKAGKSFTELAKEDSDDPGSKENGGDLGMVSRGELVKPFEDVAFKLKPGELGIAETQFGFHVIQVLAVKNARVESIDEARPKIIAALKQKQGEDAAHLALEQDIAAAGEGRGLQDIAKRRGLVAVVTPYFAEDDSIKGAEDNPKLQKDVFAMKPGEIHSVVDGPAPYLVKVLGRKAARIPPLSEIKDRVAQTLIRIHAEAKASQVAAAILKQMKSPAAFDAVAAQSHLEVKSTGEFVRTSLDVPGIGPFPQLGQTAGALTTVPGVIDHVMVNGGNAYIVKVLSRTLPSDADWKSVAAQFTERFTQQAQQTAWSNFVNELKRRAQIEVHSELIGNTPANS